jgi:hypothetical protein
MICYECSGNGFIRIPGLPDPFETSLPPFAQEQEINCPTCKGQGEITDLSKHMSGSQADNSHSVRGQIKNRYWRITLIFERKAFTSVISDYSLTDRTNQFTEDL